MRNVALFLSAFLLFVPPAWADKSEAELIKEIKQRREKLNQEMTKLQKMLKIQQQITGIQLESSKLNQLLTNLRTAHTKPKPKLPQENLHYFRKEYKTKTHLASKKKDELRLHTVDIGTGSCQILECPGDSTAIIVDCGSIGLPVGGDKLTAKGNAREYVRDILRKHKKIRLVISHPDKDHYSHIQDFMGNRTPDSVWWGGDFSEFSKKAQKYLCPMSDKTYSGKKPGYYTKKKNGEPSLSCGKAKIYVLTMNVLEGKYKKKKLVGLYKNAKSIVLYVKYGDFSAILAGDAFKTTEMSAIENTGKKRMNLDIFGGNKKITVLTASHHGAESNGSNSKKWLKHVRPEIMIYNSGGKFGHPRCEVRERLKLDRTP